jgi:hypothetical protein
MVTLKKLGITQDIRQYDEVCWIPAFAGMTIRCVWLYYCVNNSRQITILPMQLYSLTVIEFSNAHPEHVPLIAGFVM